MSNEIPVPPLIWYQDMKVALRICRVKTLPDYVKLRSKFGFFLNVPFPSPTGLENPKVLEPIVEAFLNNDEIAFLSRESATSFLEYCSKEFGLEVSVPQLCLRLRKKIIRVCSLPLGLPFQRYESVIKCYLPLLDLPPFDTAIFLRIDPLSPGVYHRIKKRFLSFEEITTYDPPTRGMMVFVQILLLEGGASVTLSTASLEEKERIEALAARINQRYEGTRWKPVLVLFGMPSQPELESFYEDISFVMSFGLDEIPAEKEYLMFELDTEPNRLVICNYFGSASQMREANILKKSNDMSKVTENIMQDLFMPNEKKMKLLKSLKITTVTFTKEYLMRYTLVIIDHIVSIEMLRSDYITEEYFQNILGPRLSGAQGLFTLVLDYDGTLLERPKGPAHQVVLQPEVKGVLERLADRCHIAIVSGRSTANLLQEVGIENITYIGNYGYEIRYKNGEEWEFPVEKEVFHRRVDMVNEIHRQAVKHGTVMLDHGRTLTYTIGTCPIYYSRQLVEKVRQIVEACGFPVGRWRDGLLVRLSNDFDKGKAVSKVLTEEVGEQWPHLTHLIYIGDDKYDEKAVKYLSVKGELTMIRVTKGYCPKSSAHVKVPDTSCVLTFLLWFEKEFGTREIQ